MSNTGRWTLAALVAVVALMVALWPRDGGDESADQTTGMSTGRMGSTEAVGPAPDAAARARAALEPCPPAQAPAPASSELSGITLGCLADGLPVDLALSLAGKPALLNLWAYWCAPCAEELPYLQDYAAQVGDAVTVLTVHSDPDEAKALARLADLGIHLPGVEDAAAQVRVKANAPNVLPLSVLVRADGSIAEVVARPFRSVDEIADTVEQALGVAA
ncbi:TlpA family protein disulfide reductase [Aldersonia kunmingensis]|uniref:TlpA family protein disulfide reductase n=1 Tax=Aldersonia kunmingensis TaxID=408066 RepID=UPI00082C5DDD|nr:TlpA disulfide reductase family protein [Aldersonia kunmingensis]